MAFSDIRIHHHHRQNRYADGHPYRYSALFDSRRPQVIQPYPGWKMERRKRHDNYHHSGHSPTSSLLLSSFSGASETMKDSGSLKDVESSNHFRSSNDYVNQSNTTMTQIIHQNEDEEDTAGLTCFNHNDSYNNNNNGNDNRQQQQQRLQEIWERIISQPGLQQLRLEVQRQGERVKPPPFKVDDVDLLLYDIFLLVNLSVSISFWVIHRLQLQYLGMALNEGCLLAICWLCVGLWNGIFLYSAVDGHSYPSSSSSSTTTNNERKKEDTLTLNDPPTKDSIDSSNQTNTNKNNDDAAKNGFFHWDLASGGGPPAAFLLALNTFIGSMNLRILIALILAMIQHRPMFFDTFHGTVAGVGGGGLISSQSSDFGLLAGSAAVSSVSAAAGDEALIPLELGCGLVLMSCWRALHSSFVPR